MATLTIDLQDADHPDQLWGLNETKKLNEIELSQEAILDRVVEILELRFSPEDQQEREAFRMYERGRILAERRTEADLRKALEFYELALTKKHNYALAYAGMAQGYNLLQTYGNMDPQTAFTSARKAAERALGIDPARRSAHTIGMGALPMGVGLVRRRAGVQPRRRARRHLRLSRLWLGSC